MHSAVTLVLVEAAKAQKLATVEYICTILDLPVCSENLKAVRAALRAIGAKRRVGTNLSYSI